MNDLFTWLTSNDRIVPMIFTTIGWIVAGTMALNNIRWRVKNLEVSHSEMKAMMDKQIEITKNVEMNSIELKQISKAGERRLQLIEDRMK